MKLKDKIAVVTGGANGIGRAMASRFVNEGAKTVMIADLDAAHSQAVAKDIGAESMRVDVSREEDIVCLVGRTEKQFGPIDLFCSNAGISVAGGFEASNTDWQRIWEINLMAHVYAARAVVPAMIARGGGYLLNTASAAGLLNQIGSAPYGVTKHAAVGFAEYLAISYGSRGIKVSVLCPQAVRTNMTGGLVNGGVAGVDGMLEPQEVADCVIRTLDEERFLVLPHPTVLTYMQRKTSDYDRWLNGMRRLNDRFSI
jgi:NAD(P)-dependent dehydrogenase (short-subunit alcohol dehydrogenase family)